MNQERRGDLMARLSAGCALGSLVLIVCATWYSGAQESVIAQWPFVVVAAGLGVGLAMFAGVLHLARRRRDGELLLEEALARMLVAASRVNSRPGHGADG